MVFQQGQNLTPQGDDFGGIFIKYFVSMSEPGYLLLNPGNTREAWRLRIRSSGLLSKLVSHLENAGYISYMLNVRKRIRDIK